MTAICTTGTAPLGTYLVDIGDELRLLLEPKASTIGWHNLPVDDTAAGRIASKGLKHIRICLAASEIHTACNVQVDHMSPMWKDKSSVESILLQQRNNPAEFGQTIAQSSIHLEYVSTRPHTAEIQKILYILNREQILARGNSAGVQNGDPLIQLKIQR